uniref:Glutathione peroxidase 1 n=1 Tax=Monopterus albus TaxID=43700 RepID=A0A3Q3QRP8_MONAL
MYKIFLLLNKCHDRKSIGLQMRNELKKLNIENSMNDEILRSLKYVRPGNGFEPKFQLLEKVNVNGKDAHPLFVFLKEKLPFPSDDATALMNDPKFIIWSPVCRNDISWNFEKFLVTPDGEPYKRYSRNFLTIDIEADIQELLKKIK